jgi:DNA-binding PadR family transcriptional regulator
VPRENTSRYAILGVLTWGSMSGYDIKKWIEKSISNFWSESYGHIYPILKSLAAEGLATSSVEPQDGRPDRNVYSITDSGREALREWLEQPIQHRVGRSELMLKLFFANRAALDSSISHVMSYRQLQIDLLQQYEDIERWVQTSMPEHPDLDYWLITIRYGKHTVHAQISWCDETLETLTRRQEQETLQKQIGSQ